MIVYEPFVGEPRRGDLFWYRRPRVGHSEPDRHDEPGLWLIVEVLGDTPTIVELRAIASSNTVFYAPRTDLFRRTW